MSSSDSGGEPDGGGASMGQVIMENAANFTHQSSSQIPLALHTLQIARDVVVEFSSCGDAARKY